MREIKFRGIRPHDGKWLYGSLLTGLFYDTSTKEDVCHILDVNEHRDYDCFQDLDNIDTDVITSTVGQYTGLKDKNGKEIYEGDILLHTGTNQSDLEVHYKDGAFFGKGIFTDCIMDMFLKAYDFQSIQVIGNIHENSEILNT